MVSKGFAFGGVQGQSPWPYGADTALIAPDGILVTRPEDAADQTARRLIALGWRPVVAPMLLVVPLPADLPDPGAVQALLVTSANALPFLPSGLHDTLLLAVGDATAAAARAAGFSRIASAGADAAALATLAAQACSPTGAPLLLAGAARQGAALAARLAREGFAVRHHAVYDAVPVTDLPQTARMELNAGRLAASMFFSPATARAFVAAFMRACRPDIVFNVEALAISDEAAAALAPLPWRRIRVARRPNQDELLALLP